MDDLRLPWWRRLSVAVIATVAAVTLATIAVFALSMIRNQRAQMLDEAIRGAALFSDSIRTSTHDQMLAGRKDEAYRLMKAFAARDQVEKVRIFNKEGRIMFSTAPGETGTMVDKKAESCYACHAAGQPLVRLSVPSRARTYRAPDGHRVLGMVTPIYNEPACASSGCHATPAMQNVLGVADVAISLREMDAETAALASRTASLAAVAVVVLSLTLALVLRLLVLKPVAGMLRVTREFTRGNLSVVVPVRAPDELGTLAESMNDMAASLAKARADRLELLNSLEQKVEQRTRALQETQNQLLPTEKLASLGKLSASIAHEINNPLAGILTFSKLLIRTLEEGTPPEKARELFLKNLKLIERETDRCRGIVRNLLDFARQRPLVLGPVDVCRALDESLTLLADTIKVQNIELEKSFEGAFVVDADFGQIRQSFVNILLNACEVMPKGGRLGVSARASDGGRTVMVSISDTGPGIPPENLTRIFDPFFTTKEMGTGLGLSVVYGIVEKHGGTMRAESSPAGTTMTISLPLASAAAGAPA
jgi:two-component system NtrC family sensor kinase